nr:hypothetical protein [Tanacetum cinerariifolium]
GKIKAINADEDITLVDMEIQVDTSVTVSDGQYAIFNGTEYAVLILLNEYSVLEIKLDTPYPMEVYTPKHFKTLSLDESRSPDFDLFSDQEEYSKEEVVETMAEIMEQYMSKTRVVYGSRVARPKMDDKDNFEIKGQFLKELRTNTFSGSAHEDANKHTKKVLEIQESDENLYQAWERFKELLMKCPQHYLTKMQEVVLFYNGLDVPTRQILDSRGVIPSKIDANAKDSDSRVEEIDLSFNPDDPMPLGIKEDDDDSERDILIHEELLDNYSLSLPVNESFHFDIPSLLHLAGSQPMLKSSYKAEDGVIISIPPLVEGVADVVVEIKGI